MKDDERCLLVALYTKRPHPTMDGLTVEEIAGECNIQIKRAYFILQKWSGNRMDFWDYGVSTHTGWLTEKGKAKALEVIGGGNAPIVSASEKIIGGLP